MSEDYIRTYKFNSALILKEMHIKLNAALRKSMATSMTVLDVDKKSHKPNELAGIFNGSRINAMLEPAFILKLLPDKSYEFNFMPLSVIQGKPATVNTELQIENAFKELQKSKAISAMTTAPKRFLSHADKINLGVI